LERDTEIDWRGCPHSLLRIILFSFTSYIYDFLFTSMHTSAQTPPPLPIFTSSIPSLYISSADLNM
jgi:hypothetical protein